MNPYLCFVILNLENSKNQIKEEVNGGHLYPQNLGNIKIPLPPLPEQRKIAAILSTVQEAKEKT
ncbi:restriction endonuclease subunit S, partial [Candidatus Sordicultor fermentans]|uniref:restriction endonuclease subunit S n=1 Tax=Candidatus Sordicultor fermentans TaxID=1953203 RepID=UPI003908A047